MTGFGRQMIEQTKEYVEANYNVAKGYEHDSVVIFGDTPPRRWLSFFTRGGLVSFLGSTRRRSRAPRPSSRTGAGRVGRMGKHTHRQRAHCTGAD